MEMGVGSADRVPDNYWLLSGGLLSSPRLGIHPQEALEVLELERAMDQIEGQWIPQEGLSLCLSEPTARQSQLPEQLASECL